MILKHSFHAVGKGIHQKRKGGFHMRKTILISFLVLFFALSLFTLAFAAGDQGTEKVQSMMEGKSNDRIFANLSKEMDETSDEQEYKVIVIFNEQFNPHSIPNINGHFTPSYEGLTARSEVVTFTPTVTGWYTIKVSSYRGSGYYTLDVSNSSNNFTPLE